MPPDPKRVQAVFLAAVESDEPAARAAVLDAECAGDAELRRRVEVLLEAHDQFDESLDVPLAGFRRGLAALTAPKPQGRDGIPDDTFAGTARPSDPTSGPESNLTVAAAAGGTSPEGTNRPLPVVEGYEVLGELGRGGMGVVYRARQIRLNRSCVLKMILAGVHADAEAIVRFLAEAEAVARLQHPHIVQIHNIGEADGLPFFELEYVEGGSLDRRLDGTPWSAQRAAELVEAMARGVAEAHRQGIIHRDLKPGNVLLAADGTPKITDFGLAKSLARDSGLTRTDSIMGSPGYMAPEQAAGKAREVGPLADVYALGAILYELLTGGAPFRGTTALEILEQVKHAEPVPPSRLVPGLPRDVETIALKCLQKEPGKRYDSAAALAEDLRRFRGGEPIVARPVPFWERAWRWCRRHPAPAALTAAIVLVGALGLAGILWQWGEAVRARREAETILVDLYATSGISAGDQGEPARAALWFANAARRAEADPDRRRSNAIRARTWGRQAFRPLRAVIAEGSWPAGLVFHPGGRYLITADVVDGDNRITEHSLFDLRSEQSLPFPGGQATVRAAAWSPDGNVLAVGLKDGDVVVAGFPGGDSPTRIPSAPGIRRLVYSTDGRYLAIAGGRSARVWDVRSRTFATPELVHPEGVTTLAFHPEGRFLATGCMDQLTRLFTVSGDATSPLWPPVPHRHQGGTGGYREFDSPPLFVNGGRELVTYSNKAGLTWRAVETGAVVRAQGFPEWNGVIASIEPSPDGRHLVVFGYQRGAVRLIEAATGRLVGPALEHTNTVMCAAFSPDSRMLATGSTDDTVRLWAVPDGKPLARPLDLYRTVHLVAFAPRGQSLVTQDFDLVRLWGLPGEGVSMARVALDGADSFVALSPDGTLAIPTGMTFVGGRGLRSTRAYHVATGQPAGPPLRPGGLIVNAAFSPDGRSVATLGTRDGRSVATLGTRDRRSGEGQTVVVWDWASGGEKWLAALPSEPRALSYRPDGRRLAVLCAGGELLIFNADDGRKALRWSSHDAEPWASHWINNGEVGFSPDGRSLLTWGMTDDVLVWDADTGRLRYPPLRHRDKCHDLQFSPDGRLMALASYDGSVRVRDPATGTVLTELPAHPDLVYSAGFSPDRRLLVTACRDRSVRVWDWRVGRLACPPFEHAKEVMTATFTPDGRWVLSASDDGTARAWDWRTGKPVTPPLTIKGRPMSLVVTPDGKHAVVGGFLDALTVLDLGELAPDDDDADADAICRQAELLAGQQFHEGGGTVNLAASGWIDRWRALRRRSPAAEIAEDRIDPGAAMPPGAGESNTSAAAGEPTALDIQDRFDLADALLRAGRIDEAIATGRELVPLLRRIVEVNPDDPSLRHRFALALVLAGDREGYRRACAATLERFDRSEDPLIGEAARACLVGPDAMLDPSVPRRLAATALSRDPKFAWSHYVLGLAEFRAGRYDRAIGHLGESLKLSKTWIAGPLNGPVLAMAHHRLGRRDEARRWLKRAHVRPSDAADGDAAVLGLSSRAPCWDRVEFQLLLREADALVLDAAFPADPFAP